MKIDSCVYQTHPELSCYHEIQGSVETSFSIGNSSQLSWNFRHKIQLGWVEFLLKMMFQLVPVSRGNRPRKTITSCKLEKRLCFLLASILQCSPCIKINQFFLAHMQIDHLDMIMFTSLSTRLSRSQNIQNIYKLSIKINHS